MPDYPNKHCLACGKTAKIYYETYIKKDSEGICKLEGCSNPTEFLNATEGYRDFCCVKHAQLCPTTKEKATKTYFDKTGYKHNSQNPENIERQKETCRKNYNSDTYFGSQQGIEMLQTRWDNATPEDIQKRQEKIIATNQKNHGVDNVFQLEEVKQKSKATNLLNHNNENYRNIEQQKITIIKNHGVGQPDLVARRSENRHKQRIKRINKIISDNNLDIELLDCKDATINYWKFKCLNCNKEFLMFIGTFQNRLESKDFPICFHCNPFGKAKYESKQEVELREFIQSHYKDQIWPNNKQEIFPQELDVYIPDLNLAFEYNGLYWHCEIRCKNPQYHKIKTERCEAKNIHLIHIWEDDWMYKEILVKSKILEVLGIVKKELSSNDCQIKILTDDEKEIFLDGNDIRGNIKSLITIGLIYQNVLVYVMSFGDYTFKTTPENCYEILRSANKAEYKIIGAEQKIFEYFVKEYNPIRIGCFLDRCWHSSLQKTFLDSLGFKFKKCTNSNYSYLDFDEKELKKIDRFNLSDFTKEEIKEMGYVRIFGAGYLIYEWNK